MKERVSMRRKEERLLRRDGREGGRERGREGDNERMEQNYGMMRGIKGGRRREKTTRRND